MKEPAIAGALLTCKYYSTGKRQISPSYISSKQKGNFMDFLSNNGYNSAIPRLPKGIFAGNRENSLPHFEDK
jgi:hypothetical protein